MKHIPMLLGVLLAQTPPLLAAEITPTDAAAAVPSVSYRSAFEGYRPATEEPVADWRALNDEVAAIGGHIGIMRGASGSPRPGNASPVLSHPPHRHGSER